MKKKNCSVTFTFQTSNKLKWGLCSTRKRNRLVHGCMSDTVAWFKGWVGRVWFLQLLSVFCLWCVAAAALAHFHVMNTSMLRAHQVWLNKYIPITAAEEGLDNKRFVGQTDRVRKTMRTVMTVSTVRVMEQMVKLKNCSGNACVSANIFTQMCTFTYTGCVWENSGVCNTVVSTDGAWSWWKPKLSFSDCVYQSFSQTQQHTCSTTDYKYSQTIMQLCARTA